MVASTSMASTREHTRKNLQTSQLAKAATALETELVLSPAAAAGCTCRSGVATTKCTDVCGC